MRRALLPLTGLLALLTPLPVLALVCWWLVVSAEMPGRSWARRSLNGLLTSYAVTAGALTALAVAHLSCQPRLLLAVLLAAGLTWRLRRPAATSVALLAERDRWALGFGALTFVTLYTPFLGAGLGRTMALLSQTTDGATHVQLVEAINRYRGYVHLLHPVGLSPGADHYPTAWHGNVWVLGDLLFGAHPSVAELVGLVAVAAVASYAVLSALAALVVLELTPQDARPGARLAGLTSLALATLVGFGLFFLQLDSYTQVFALVAVLALGLLAADGTQPVPTTLVVVAACSITVMQSWYLLAPLLVAAGLVLLSSLRPGARSLLVMLALTAPFCLYPLLTGPSSTHLDLPGPKILPTLAGLLGLLVATGVGCAAILRRTGSQAAVLLVATTVASLVTMVALVAKQGFVAGSGVSYYGAKVLLATLLLGAVLASALVVSAASRPRSRTGVAGLVALGGLALGTWATAWDAIPPSVGRYEGHLEPRMLTALLTRHPGGEPAGTTTWIVDGCDRVGDLVATKWIYDTTLRWTTAASQDLNDYASDPHGEARALLSRLRDPSVRTFELLVHRECDPALLRQVTDDPKVRVIRIP